MQRTPLIILPLLIVIGLIGGAFFMFGTSEENPDTSLSVKPVDEPLAPTPPPSRSSSGKSSRSSGGTNESGERETPARTERVVKEKPGILGTVMKGEEPAPKASVHLLDGKNPLKVVASTLTNEGGAYRFEDLASNDSYIVALIDEAHALAVSEPLQFTADIMKHVVPLEARAQSELMIRIVDDKKAAIEDASIQIDQQPALEAALRLAMTFAMTEEERPARPVELRSDKEGSFATNWLASDEYTFSAAKKGFQGPPPAADGDTQSRRAMGSVATSTDRKSTLTLMLYGVRQLMGTVVSELKGLPVPFATVRIWSEFQGEVARTTCDEFGAFAVDDPIGDTQVLLYRFIAQAEGFGTGTRRGMENEESGLIGEIKLPPGATLSGIVIDDAKKPIAGASVFISQGMMERGMDQIVGMSKPQKLYATTTGDDGRFTILGLPASNEEQGDNPNDNSDRAQQRRMMRGMMGNAMTVVAEASGYATGASDLKPFQAGENREIEIVVGVAGRIVGRVVDPTGVGIPGATIAAAPGSNPMMGMGFRFAFQGNIDGGARRMMPGMDQIQFTMTTDENGNFVIESLTPGPYLVGGKKTGLSAVIKEGVTVNAGEDTELTIELTYSGVIFGTYYDEDQRATGGKSLTLAGMATMTFRQTETGADGSYRFEGVMPGSYKVIPSPSDPNDQSQWMRMASTNDGGVTIEGGEEKRFDVYEKPINTTRLFGKVTLNGVSYANSNLSVAGGSFGGLSFATVKTDERGEYEIKSIALGGYSVTLGSLMPGTPGFLQNTQIVVTEKPEQEVNIDMRSFTISGTVTLKTGAPIGNDVIVFATKQVDTQRTAGYRRPFDDFQTNFVDQRRVNGEDGTYSIDQLSEGTYIVTARSSQWGMVRSNPIRLNRDFGPLKLELDGRVGSIVGIVQNYAPPEGGTMMGPMMGDRATLTFEDEQGNGVNLGSTGRIPMMGDNSVALEKIEGSTNRRFELKGVPVGTWVITFQSLNYAPVTQTIRVEADLVTNQSIVLQKSGHLELEILNQNLPADASQNFELKIIASNGTEFIKRITMAEMMEMMFNQGESSGKQIITLKDFPPDSYTMTARLPGFKPSEIGFSILPEQTTQAAVTFIKE